MLFAWELQRRAGGNLVCVALHPGEVLTDVVRSLPSLMRKAYRLLLQTILLTPEQGAGWGWGEREGLPFADPGARCGGCRGGTGRARDTRAAAAAR